MRPVRVAVAGSVDDGKSTLLGRLVSDAERVFSDEAEAVRRASGEALNLAFFTDGLVLERAQGITLDVAWRHVMLGSTRLLLADVPGHAELVRNMATGASTADAALLLVDAVRGVQPQTRRHLVMLAGLGVTKVVVCLNKMDGVGFSEQVATALVLPLLALARPLGLALEVIPVSALDGDNVVHRSARLPWYAGPTVAERLGTLELRDEPKGVRAAVQLASTPEGWTALHLLSGSVATGMTLELRPGGGTCRVLEVSPLSPSRVRVDRPLARGTLLAEPNTVACGAELSATATWLGPTVGVEGLRVTLLQQGRSTPGAVHGLQRVSQDTGACEPAAHLVAGDVARLTLTLDAETWLTGEALLTDDAGQTIAGLLPLPAKRGEGWGGGPSASAENAGGERSNGTARPSPDVGARFGPSPQPSPRWRKERESGATIWLTGLPCAGKTTLAHALAERLRAQHRTVLTLDGDEIRQTLSRDLGFDERSRRENVRRCAAVAELTTRAGAITLVALVSPNRAAREDARALHTREQLRFLEVHVAAPLAVCEARDLKGLYARGRAGLTRDVTGLDAPYEAPLAPEVTIPPELDVSAAVELVLRALQ